MASTCAGEWLPPSFECDEYVWLSVGALALMDAGVPIKRPVAGISVGLMSRFSDDDSQHPDHKDYTLLTDIMGLEDHYGDMDFKVTGTEVGVTAVQLDVKLAGLCLQLLHGFSLSHDSAVSQAEYQCQFCVRLSIEQPWVVWRCWT